MNTRARKAKRLPIGTRYPEDRVRLLQALRIQRGDEHLSDLIATALDEMLERHLLLPGEQEGAGEPQSSAA